MLQAPATTSETGLDTGKAFDYFNIFADTLSEDKPFALVLVYHLGIDMAIAFVTTLES